MANIPIKFSMPESIVRDLHLYISKRHRSKFVAEMIAKGLEAEKERLAREYQEASEDEDRNKENEMWDILSDELAKN